MTKCLGCGAILQDEDKDKPGYTHSLSNKLCLRCFNITHYNKDLKLDLKDYKIKKINEKDLVLLVTDFLNLYDLNLNIKNPVILVITKADLLPKSLNQNHFLKNLNIKDKIIVSSKNNYNLDLLYEKIIPYKKAYVIGFTNAGKSTLVNKMVKNYGNNDSLITVSNLPMVTLDFIKTKVNADLTLIDTPGFLDEKSMVLKGENILKKITPTKEIKPIIYQIKAKQSILIEDFVRLDIKNNTNIILYMSNNLNIKRIYKEKPCEMNKVNLTIKANSDLVIKGLGFITFKQATEITLWLIDDVNYLIRDHII